MNYDFKVTISRIINKDRIGSVLVFDGTQDLDEIFTPKITAMILKNWAKTLEERQSVIPCPKEIFRNREEFDKILVDVE